MFDSLKKIIIHFRFLLKTLLSLAKENYFWFKHDFKFSATTCHDEISDLAKLIINSHVLEKGITMPGRKLGFGYERIRLIISQCNKCIKLYGNTSVEVQLSLKALEQYLALHKERGFILAKDIEEGITELINNKIIDTKNCYETTKDSFFTPTKDFFEFAHQRHTLRWYSSEIVEDETIKKVVELAMTAPSACNRQSIKVYVISTEEKKRQLLEMQIGHRGFGQQADKLLCITTDSRYYAYNHRPMANVDGGIFTMNLLYALHYYKIAACTLNACISIKDRKRLCDLIGMNQSEFPIVFISIGKAPSHFMVAASQRKNLERILYFV